MEEEGVNNPRAEGEQGEAWIPALPMEGPCTKGRQNVVWGSVGTPWRYLDSPSSVVWQAVCMPCILA